MHWSIVDRLKIDPLLAIAERQAQPADGEGAAVRNGDSPADPGGAKVLSPLKDAEQGAGGSLIHLEQPYHFGEYLLFRRPSKRKIHRIRGKEVLEVHAA
jgi:hypothetical protein